jgi:hypothetical protein
MALAGSADNRYTLDLVPAMLAPDVPKLLVWGEDDTFQKLGYAERSRARSRAASPKSRPSAAQPVKPPGAYGSYGSRVKIKVFRSRWSPATVIVSSA